MHCFIPNLSVLGPTTMVCRCVTFSGPFFKEEKVNASLPPASTELSELSGSVCGATLSPAT